MNFNNLLQQAQQMQRKVNKAKRSFDEKIFEIESQENIITKVNKEKEDTLNKITNGVDVSAFL